MSRARYSGPPGVSSEPRTVHSEHCPFCGADFDPRDLGQVLEHYDHQLAAGIPAIDETPEPGTRSYTVEVKDTETGQTVMLMSADWDEHDKRVALARLMRLAGVPDDNCLLDEVAPKPAPRQS